MKDYLSGLLLPLSEKIKTGICIFDEKSECVFSSEGKTVPKAGNAMFTNGIAVSGGYTYFRFGAGKITLTGAVAGTDGEAGKLAYLLSALLEKRVTSKELSREDKIRALILGEADFPLVYELKQKLGKNCYNVFAVSCSKKDTVAIYDFLAHLMFEDDSVIRVDSHIICLLKKLDNSDDYQSANEFALLLNESISQELGKQIMIGIGGVAGSVSDIPRVYGQAVSAFRLGKLSEVASNIYSYKELVMMKMIEDIPRETLQSYLNILADKSTLEILADEEMMSTAKEFLSNSLNISETSRLMYMHRNTLIYRLDKIEKATGLNIRNFSDAVTFRMILILYRLLNSKQ